MEILKFPDPHLLKPTQLVTVFGEELSILLDEMWVTMKANAGVGLAANQLGLSQKMFVLDSPLGRLDCVNPEIVEKSKSTTAISEGCLSAPGTFVVIPSRFYAVRLKYQNKKGEKCVVALEGVMAVAAQHELEHLDGKSFLSNKSIKKHDRNMLKKQWSLR